MDWNALCAYRPSCKLCRLTNRFFEPYLWHMMKTFSLRTVLVIVAFAALTMSHFLVSLRLSEANRELDGVRRNYGYMKIEDGTKINVISLVQDKGTNRDALRFIIPPGELYYLHLSETTANENSILPSGRHKTTVALNSWVDGEDVIIQYRLGIDPKKQTPYLDVSSPNEGFFTYLPDDWPSGVSLSMAFQLDVPKKTEISPKEPIVLMRAKTDAIDRGIVLWLESESHRKSRANQ